MDIKIVFLIIGIIYWVFKNIYSKNDDKKVVVPKNNNAPRPQSSSQKSVEDIFSEFVRDVENKRNPKPQVRSNEVKPVVKRKDLDWQQVSKSKFVTKKQLIKHEDYHAEHGKIHDIVSIDVLDSIESSEGKVYQFDKNNIDWKQAVITKEILDRKYA